MQNNRNFLGIVIAVVGALLSAVFLANPGIGVLFEIPDVVPLVGNLDEVAVSAIFFSCLSYLGINVIPRPRSGSGSRVIDERPGDKRVPE